MLTARSAKKYYKVDEGKLNILNFKELLVKVYKHAYINT